MEYPRQLLISTALWEQVASGEICNMGAGSKKELNHFLSFHWCICAEIQFLKGNNPTVSICTCESLNICYPSQLDELNSGQLVGGIRQIDIYLGPFFGQTDDRAASLFLLLRCSMCFAGVCCFILVFVLLEEQNMKQTQLCYGVLLLVETNLILCFYVVVVELLCPSLVGKLGGLKRYFFPLIKKYM